MGMNLLVDRQTATVMAERLSWRNFHCWAGRLSVILRKTEEKNNRMSHAGVNSSVCRSNTGVAPSWRGQPLRIESDKGGETSFREIVDSSANK